MLKLAVATLAFALPTFLAAQSSYPNAGQPAPITRAGRGAGPREQQPAPGGWVRSDRPGGVTAVPAGAGKTEVRLTAGRADVILNHPEPETEILVDLPGGGQVSLLKDGFYTFNADTSTARVLHGEAIAYTGPAETHGTKVRETQQLSFNAGQLHATDADRAQLESDILPGNERDRRGDYAEGGGYGGGFGGGYGEGYGPYGDGFYGGYPYAGFGYGYYPYGGFYPYGYGYPFGLGIGFGYFGGFRGGYGGFGGFRGGIGGFRR